MYEKNSKTMLGLVLIFCCFISAEVFSKLHRTTPTCCVNLKQDKVRRNIQKQTVMY